MVRVIGDVVKNIESASFRKAGLSKLLLWFPYIWAVNSVLLGKHPNQALIILVVSPSPRVDFSRSNCSLRFYIYFFLYRRERNQLLVIPVLMLLVTL